jgi:small subunit ribosomal protein S16
MVVIRMQRKGKPHQPYYRVVAIEKARGATGKPIEVLGSYNPRTETQGKKVEVDQTRYEYWIGVGAQPSPTVRSLVKAAFKVKAASAK